MINRLYQRLVDTLKEGLSAGFTTGLLELFLILLGIPTNIKASALFLLLLVIVIFGVRLARKLREETLAHLMGNAVAMGIVASLFVLALMSLINNWQQQGIRIQEKYFHSINLETMEVLSGVPEEELFANPPRDVFTGDYPEGEPLRTNPMRLTFDPDTGLDLLGLNLVIGGLYGFLLVLIFSGLLAALLTWGFIRANLGEYWATLTTSSAENPLTHLISLIMPLLVFMLLWLTVGHGTFNPVVRKYSSINPIIDLGANSQDLQLLIGFGIILFALIAVRAARSDDWGLAYPVRVGICLGAVALLVGLGIWRIVNSEVYFIATGDALKGDQTLSIIVALMVGGLLTFQNVTSLREPGRFEFQLAGTLSLLVVVLMPLYLNQGQNDVMTIVGIYVMLGLGLNIVVGYAGLLDLGYVAFFALGAYAYAFISSNQRELGEDSQPAGLKFEGNDEMVVTMAGWIVITVVITLAIAVAGVYWWRYRQERRNRDIRPPLIEFAGLPTNTVTALLTVGAILLSVIVASLLESAGVMEDVFDAASPFLIGMILGLIVAGLSGIALGIPVLRLRGDYLAIVTLGFGEIIRLLFTNLRDYTGGPQGVLEIPRPLPDGATGNVTYLTMLYLVFIGAGIVAFLSIRLKRSRTGRAWSAMRSDEDIAQSMGINLVQSKLMAFAIGATFAGIGGVLFAARQRNIYPNDFNLNVSIEVLSLVIIGGMGSIPGVIMGAIALIGVPEVLRELATYRILAFGALLIVMVIVRPEGLLPAPVAQLRDHARSLVEQSDSESHHREGEA